MLSQGFLDYPRTHGMTYKDECRRCGAFRFSVCLPRIPLYFKKLLRQVLTDPLNSFGAILEDIGHIKGEYSTLVFIFIRTLGECKAIPGLQLPSIRAVHAMNEHEAYAAK